MDIAELSNTMSQVNLSQEAALKVSEMALDNTDIQAQALEKLFASAQVVSDPALGQYVDIFA